MFHRKMAGCRADEEEIDGVLKTQMYLITDHKYLNESHNNVIILNFGHKCNKDDN